MHAYIAVATGIRMYYNFHNDFLLSYIYIQSAYACVNNNFVKLLCITIICNPAA